MVAKPQARETIQRLRQNDLAKQIVIRFRHDPRLIRKENHNRQVQQLRELAATIHDARRRPETVAEWIGLVLFYGSEPGVGALREAAKSDVDLPFSQAQRWLTLIDHTRRKHTP